MGVPAAVLGFIIGMMLAGTIDPDSLTGNLIFNLIGGFFGIAIFLAVNGFLLATRGQTVGKTIVKTQIVADDGSMMPFGPLILKRYLPFWILGMIPYLGLLNLVNVLMIFRESHKCLHDEIAGTKVISLK